MKDARYFLIGAPQLFAACLYEFREIGRLQQLNQQLGAQAELGYGIAVLNLGVSYRL